MAITGILYKNQMFGNFCQNSKASGKAAQGFQINSYGNSANVTQSGGKTTVRKDIDPLKVDPRNATYEEIMALNHYLVEQGMINKENINSFERPTKDDTEKADYYNALRSWRETQYQAGNMVGYKNAATVFNAWMNRTLEMDGNVEYINGSSVWAMETSHLTSGKLGFGSLDDKSGFSACYADDSTSENPVVEVRVTDKKGKETIVRVNVDQVDPTNATELEMLALLAHQDAQGMTGNTEFMGSYWELIDRAKNSAGGDLSSKNAQDFMSWRRNWRNMTLGATDSGAEQMLIKKRKEMDNGVPYGYLAKDGMIKYNGVTFVCDEEHKALRLGNTSDPKKCLNIPLSGGGCLIVNRDNIGDLSRAIGMFSPEDVKLILQAIAQDAKIQQMKNEIDDETSGIDLAEETGETEPEKEEQK